MADEKKEETGKIPENYVFYSPITKESLSVPVVDEKGHPVIVKNIDGSPRYLDGRPLVMKRPLRFETISRNAAKGCLSIYVIRRGDRDDFTVEQKEEIRVLTEKAKSRDSQIMTEDDYKRSRNREAFERQIEVERLKADNARKDDAIADMQKQLERLRGTQGGTAHIQGNQGATQSQKR